MLTKGTSLEDLTLWSSSWRQKGLHTTPSLPVLVGEADSPGVFRLASVLLLRGVLPLGDNVANLKIVLETTHLCLKNRKSSSFCLQKVIITWTEGAPWCLLAGSAPALAQSGHQCTGWNQKAQFSLCQCPGWGDTGTRPLWSKHRSSPPVDMHWMKAMTMTVTLKLSFSNSLIVFFVWNSNPYFPVVIMIYSISLCGALLPGRCYWGSERARWTAGSDDRDSSAGWTGSPYGTAWPASRPSAGSAP